MAKDLLILGGPNGAGKTTTAARLLPHDLGIREFVNADEIARGISPFNPEATAIMAGRVMIERMRALVAAGESFAFETTCSGRAHAEFLRSCRGAGYRITLIYLWLNSPQMALARVARRVDRGGHSIPPDVVTRRYHAGIRNMRDLYLPLADVASIYDNSDGAGGTLIAQRTAEGHFVVRDPTRWALIACEHG